MRKGDSGTGCRFPILRGALAGIVFLAFGSSVPAGAEEIRFRNGNGMLTGTVLEESGETVTIRFPREVIESITPEAGARPERPAGERTDPGLETRVRELERKMEALSSPDVPDFRGKGGDVGGTIRWKNAPLSHARVLVVPRIAAGRPMSAGRAEGMGETGRAPVPEGSYETRTDAEGRYRIERVSPGEYLLYWMPDEKAGWVRRLRDRPDLVVAPGKTTVLNIPEERN